MSSSKEIWTASLMPFSMVVRDRKGNFPKQAEMRTFESLAKAYIAEDPNCFMAILQDGRDVVARFDNGRAEFLVGFRVGANLIGCGGRNRNKKKNGKSPERL